MSDGQAIAGVLHSQIKKLKLSLTAVERRTGIPYRTLQNYVYGKSDISAVNLAKIADAISMSVEAVLVRAGIRRAALRSAAHEAMLSAAIEVLKAEVDIAGPGAVREFIERELFGEAQDA